MTEPLIENGMRWASNWVTSSLWSRRDDGPGEVLASLPGGTAARDSAVANRGDPLVPLRMVSARGVSGGARLGRRAAMVSAIAMALGSGERVKVFAATEADAEMLMSEARKLLRRMAGERSGESS